MAKPRFALRVVEASVLKNGAEVHVEGTASFMYRDGRGRVLRATKDLATGLTKVELATPARTPKARLNRRRTR